MASDPYAGLPPETGRAVALVDSSVILDIVTDDPDWAAWSAVALAKARDEGSLVINPIVYAEVSTGFDRVEDLDDALPRMTFSGSSCPTRRGSWPARRFWPTGDGEVGSTHRSRISTSALTPPCVGTGYLPETPPGTEPISRPWTS